MLVVVTRVVVTCLVTGVAWTVIFVGCTSVWVSVMVSNTVEVKVLVYVWVDGTPWLRTIVVFVVVMVNVFVFVMYLVGTRTLVFILCFDHSSLPR